MKKHFGIKIQGVVQGVFFRASTKQKAEELAIKGFVRNEADGSVYVEAEGGEQELKQFIAWCQHGPPRAEVRQFDLREGSPKGYSQFIIERSFH